MAATNDMRGLRNLLQKRPTREPAVLIMGVVETTPGGGVITVFIEGAEVASPDIRYLASYAPTIGDAVWMLKSGPDILCLGDLA